MQFTYKNLERGEVEMSLIDIKSAALNYVNKFNLPIIPICSHDHSNMTNNHLDICYRPGKRPLLRSWQRGEKPSIEAVNNWFHKIPNANLGLVLGSKSNIVGIDVDGDLGEDILKELSSNDLPKTWMFLTPGGGKRYLYSIPEGLILRKYEKSQGDHNECALLGEGQMTVLPPSIHANGKKYSWLPGHGPHEIELEKAPNWMISLMTSKTHSIENKNYKDSKDPQISLSNQCVRFKSDWQLQQQIGLSEEEWFRWIALLTSAGYPESALSFSKASSKHNKGSEDRVKQLTTSNRDAMVRCLTLGCNEKQIQKCFDGQIRKNQEGEITNSPGSFIKFQSLSNSNKGYTNDELKEIGFIFSEKSNKPIWINENMYANHVLKVMDLLYFGPGERFYNYSNGLWISNDSNSIARKLRDLLHSYVQHIWSGKMEKAYLGALMREAPRVEKLDAKRDYINLENGMLNLKKLSLDKHHKDFYSTVRIPIKFDPQAKCPNFIKFLNDVFNEDQELVKLISQILGYCITAEVKAQKGFIFYGKGANGKSVLVDLLTKLCGKENISAVTLNELDNSFARYELVDKLVNLSTENEVGSGELNTQYFKAIVSGDPIRVEQKHETGFMYEPFAKLVFALNNLPYAKDHSTGFQRRLIIVPFNRTFAPEEQDVDLPAKLDKELPGILNFALKGLESLRDNKYKFIDAKAVKEAVEDYSEQLNPVRSFVKEMIELGNPDDKILNHKLKEVFSDWCEDNGINNQYSPATVLNRIKDILRERKIPFELGKASAGKRCLKGLKWSKKQLALQDNRDRWPDEALLEENDIYSI